MITATEQTRFNANLSPSSRKLIGPPNHTIGDELDRVNKILTTVMGNDTHDELFDYSNYLRSVRARNQYER